MHPQVHLTRRISLRMQQLDMFLNLMETASVRATADKMGLTQSAISKSLKELESTMGVCLFERTSSGLHPTKHCDSLERYARGVIHGFNVLCRELHAPDASDDIPLNVGATVGEAYALLTRLIRHPRIEALPIQVTVQMESSQHLIDRLMDNALDIIIAHAGTDTIPEQIRHLPAGHDTIVAVARPSHPVFHEGRAHHHYPWMLPESGAPIRTLIEQSVKAARCRMPRALLECASSPSEPEAAIRDELVAWTTRTLADPWVERGRLQYLPLPFTPPTLEYHAMRLRHRHQTLGSFTLWDELLRELRARRQPPRQDGDDVHLAWPFVES